MKSIIGLSFLVIALAFTAVGGPGAFVSQAAKDPPGSPRPAVLPAFEGPNSDTFSGFQAGNGLGTSDNHDASFFGWKAGVANGTGQSNTFIGGSAGIANTGGSFNTFVGKGAGLSNVTGSNNTFMGIAAWDQNTAGGNTFVGASAGRANVSGTGNAFFGSAAGLANTGSSNTFIGLNAGHSNTTANTNTFVGSNAGSANTTSINNAYFGASAGFQSTGSNNTFLGAFSGVANTSGTRNTFVGRWAGFTTTVGVDNIYIGDQAGFSSTGSGNVFIGSSTGKNETTSNKLYIDNSNTSAPLIYGDFNTDLIAINGKLGVGTQAPQTTLQVGSGTLAPFTAGTSLMLQPDAGNPAPGPVAMVMKSNTSAEMFLYEDQNNGLMGTASNTPFGLRSNNLTRLWVGSNGNIGIGQFLVAPTALLQLNGGANSNGTTWNNASSRSLKENFRGGDSQSVLQKLISLPVETWNYKTEGEGIRHLGPTAEDFKAAFGLGGGDTSIATVDADGVSMVAIKGLYEQVLEKDARIADLETRLAAVDARLRSVEGGSPGAFRTTAAAAAPATTRLLALAAALLLFGMAAAAVIGYRRRSCAQLTR